MKPADHPDRRGTFFVSSFKPEQTADELEKNFITFSVEQSGFAGIKPEPFAVYRVDGDYDDEAFVWCRLKGLQPTRMSPSELADYAMQSYKGTKLYGLGR